MAPWNVRRATRDRHLLTRIRRLVVRIRVATMEGHHSHDEVKTMSESACFKPRVVEPVAVDRPDGLGLAVELWLSRPVDGIAGRAVRIHLRSGARMEEAETLRDLLNAVGTNIVVS
jgi:hypothetical protein